jgi:alpha 1,6-mannosyltransferase
VIITYNNTSTQQRTTNNQQPTTKSSSRGGKYGRMLTFKRATIIAAAFLFTFYFLFPRSSSPHFSPASSSSRPGRHYTRPPQSGSKYNTDKFKPQIPNLVKQPPQGAGREAMAAASPGAPPVAQQKQKIENLLDLPLVDQLAYHFPYDVQTRFPAYIWQTWKHVPGSAKFEEKFRVPEASWTEKHPEFVHEVRSFLAPPFASCG